MGAVARIFHPGIKFDTMLILAGPQGIGKSTFFRYLGMDWYSDSLCTFEQIIPQLMYPVIQRVDRKAVPYFLLAGDLGMTKSEMNTVKQFLSKCDDVYRAAYGRRTEKYLRQCPDEISSLQRPRVSSGRLPLYRGCPPPRNSRSEGCPPAARRPIPALPDEAKPDTPAANLPSFKKMCEFAAEQPAVAELMAKERYEAAVQSFSYGAPFYVGETPRIGTCLIGPR